MNNYLADTTVIIEHLRGNLKAKQFLEKENPYISTVTIAELIQGARDKDELRFAVKAETSLPELAIDKKIAKVTIELLQNFHLSHGLQFLDALIAATVIEHKLILVTGNVKHFRFIEDLDMIPQEDIFSNF